MTSDQAIQLLASQIANVRCDFGVQSLSLFGSAARGEARPDSDVDVLVEFADRPTFDRYMGLKEFLEQLLGARVDLAITSDMRPAFRPRVEREALPVPCL